MRSDRGQRFYRAPAGPAIGRALGRAPMPAPGEIVGITTIEAMLMTPGAQENEMRRIDNDVRSFNTEITGVVQSHGGGIAPPKDWTDVARFAHDIAAQPAAVANDPLVQLYTHVWAPFFQTWASFYADNKAGAWFSNPVSEAEKYQEQLIDIRAKASELGMHVLSPAPKQEHPEGMPSWLLPVGVGVGGLVLLSLVTRN